MTATDGTKSAGPPRRLWRFLNRPWSEKTIWLQSRWYAIQLFWEKIPVLIPMRLAYGGWWVARNDYVGRNLRKGRFESAELRFVGRFLQPDMVVLDIGAHHGLYTLLASRLVGARGKVLAFEPSARERKALSLHMSLNRCKNVQVLPFALGKETTDADLYVVEASASGCNSLRPPASDVLVSSHPQRVRVVRLDDQLSVLKIDHVDFIKLDVEGGELAVLEGASQLLSRRPRPVILAEVQDVRTQPWGYRARKIIDYLRERGYQWFCFSPEGLLETLDINRSSFDGNFVACPEECLTALQSLSHCCIVGPDLIGRTRAL